MPDFVNKFINEFVVTGQPNRSAEILNNLAREQLKATAATGAFDRATTRATVSVQRFDEHGNKVRQTFVRTAEGIKNFKTEIIQAGNAGVKAGEQLTISWRSVLRIIAGTLISRAVRSLVSSFEHGANEAAEFSIRIGEIRTISQQAQQSTTAWTDQVIALSNEFNKSAFDVAEGTYQALSNQIAEGAEATAFMSEALRLSIITVQDAETSVNALTAVLNAYGEGVDKAKLRSDQLFKIVELGRLRLNEISDSFGRSLILASDLGISFEEVGSALTVLTIRGVKAAEAQTFLRNVLLKLINPTEEMTKFFEELGVQGGQSAIEAFGFAGVLKLLNERVERSADRFSEISDLFSRIRATIGFSGLSAAFEDFTENVNAITDATESADEALENIKETVGFRFQREFNEIKNFFLQDFGLQFVEGILNITDKLGGLANLIKSTTPTVIELVGAVAFASVFTLSIRSVIGLTNAVLALGNSFTAAGTQALTARQNLALGINQLSGLGSFAITTASFFITEKILDDLEIAAGKRIDIEEAITSKVVLESEKRINQYKIEQEEFNRVTDQFVDDSKRRLNSLFAETRASLANQQSLINTRQDLSDILFESQLRGLGDSGQKTLLQKRIQELFSELRDAASKNSTDLIQQLAKDLDSLISRFEGIKGSRQFREVLSVPPGSFGQRIFRFPVTGGGTASDFRKQLNDILSNQIDNLDEQISIDQQTLNVLRNGLDRIANSSEEVVKRIEDLNQRIKDQETDLFRELSNSLVNIRNLTAFLPTFTKALGDNQLRFGTSGQVIGGQEALDRFNSFKEVVESLQQIQTLVPEGEFDPLLIREDLASVQLAVSNISEAFKSLPTEGFTKEFVERVQANLNLIQAGKNLDDQTAKLIEIQGRNANIRERLQTDFEAVQKIQESINSEFSDGLDNINKFNEVIQGFRTNLEALNTAIQNITTSLGTAQVLPPTEFFGGRFAGGGGVGSDQISALLAPGEFVTNRRATASFLPLLQAINSGGLTSNRFNGGGNVSVGDINVTVKGGDTSDITVRRIGQGIRRDISRGLLRLN